jgi:hypothetical protein
MLPQALPTANLINTTLPIHLPGSHVREEPSVT